jgi:hypothetical protein
MLHKLWTLPAVRKECFRNNVAETTEIGDMTTDALAEDSVMCGINTLFCTPKPSFSW